MYDNFLLFWHDNKEFFTRSLEVKLGEEPLVLTSLMLLLKGLLNGLLGLLTLRRLLESLSANNVLQSVQLKSVTSGHDVIEVDNLDKGLDLGSLSNLLSAVSLGDLQGVSLDTSN